MPSYTVSYNPEFHCVEVELCGAVDLSIADEIRSKVIELLQKHNCSSALTDLRNCSSNLSTLDIYNRPQELAEKMAENSLSAHQFKRALVVGPQNESANFYETVALNRGHNVRIFEDICEARKWLSEES